MCKGTVYVTVCGEVSVCVDERCEWVIVMCFKNVSVRMYVCACVTGCDSHELLVYLRLRVRIWGWINESIVHVNRTP